MERYIAVDSGKHSTKIAIYDQEKEETMKFRFRTKINEGYFEDEGIQIELILTPGADAVMSSVLSGDVDIGFSGTEATIYVYNGGEKDYPITFAALTKRDGAFLVSREKIDNFSLNDLKGKTIIGGRKI